MGRTSEIEFIKSDSGEPVGQAHRLPDGQLAGGAPALQPQDSARAVKLNSREWDETVQKLASTFNHAGSRLPNGRDGSPSRPLAPARPAVAPYQTLPVAKLSALQEDETRYYATEVLETTSDYLKLATVSWLKEPLEAWLARAENKAPATIVLPTAAFYKVPEIVAGICIDDTWTATAGPPDGRQEYTAVWTGSEMIVWGGSGGSSIFNTGGKSTILLRTLGLQLVPQMRPMPDTTLRQYGLAVR